MVEEKKSLAPVHQRKKIAAILSLIFYFVLLSGVGMLFWSQWNQIWYWDYLPFLWGFTAGVYIVVSASIAFIVCFFLFGRIWSHWYKDIPVRRLSTAFSGLTLILMIAGSGVVWVFAYNGITDSFYNSGPYLTWSTNQDPTNSITVCWYSAIYTGSVVHYGLNITNLNLEASNSFWGQNHNVSISNLQVNTTYYYQVGVFPTKQFTTAPEGTFNYTVDIWADPRTNDGGINDPEIVNDQPNLPLHMMTDAINSGTKLAFDLFCGDEVDFGVDYASWHLWLNDISTLDFASNRTVEVAIGNHEYHEDPTGRNFHNFWPYAEDAEHAFYYSFNYGNVHYDMIDPLNPLYNGTENNWWEMTPTEQTWLENDLAANQNATFRIICVHPTAYDEGLPTTGDDFDGDIYQVLTPIALQYHVNVVFSGHIHDYEVDNFNGTLWMRLGIGGNTDWGMNDSGYVQMAVSANQLMLRSIYTNGQQFDTNVVYPWGDNSTY